MLITRDGDVFGENWCGNHTTHLNQHRFGDGGVYGLSRDARSQEPEFKKEHRWLGGFL
jgi:hypothetical protein